mgnify:FL=1
MVLEAYCTICVTNTLECFLNAKVLNINFKLNAIATVMARSKEEV